MSLQNSHNFAQKCLFCHKMFDPPIKGFFRNAGKVSKEGKFHCAVYRKGAGLELSYEKSFTQINRHLLTIGSF